ncbi:hypothetical protein GCM10023321_09690 [Pseudonocardia eucalypti]|uniref:ABC transporter n=1 Tax=Pseudonocardia eucalypti TaxID=648755 RepID=A0ABP9PKN7_9PSEU|nr:ABC-type Mn2+/Zn2+ transport system permease subunit [Pseudonocardia eucalypti]
MDWLIAPFEVSFVFRALCGGLLVSALCALVGTWVVLRGMAFLGEALSHGMLPGVGLAMLFGAHPLLGAAASAAAMTAGVTLVGRRSRLSQDTAIALLFVGMLALGVVIVSRSRSFAVDLTAILFGDILAMRWSDIGLLLGALALASVVSLAGYRPFLALAFDPRKAATLGLHPARAHYLQLGLITVTIVASYQAVGTLLVVGLLIAPPATAALWANRVPSIMALATGFGALATVAGLLVSWHAGTAAGATIAAVAVLLFFVSLAARRVSWRRTGRAGFKIAPLAAGCLLLAGCASGPVPEPKAEPPHGYVPGAEEMAEPQTRLVYADPAGRLEVLDLSEERTRPLGTFDRPDRLTQDGRFAYLSSGNALHVVDGGAWTVDHGDHKHYYRREPAVRARIDSESAPGAALGNDGKLAVVYPATGTAAVYDLAKLEEGRVERLAGFQLAPHDGFVLPFSGRYLATEPSAVVARDGTGAPLARADCAEPSRPAVTRAGAVFGCAGGALLATAGEDGAPRFEAINYPDPGPRARAFGHRPGSGTLASVAGDQGVWVLDVPARRWTLLHTPRPMVTAAAVGDGRTVLAVDADGRLHGLDQRTGQVTASTEPFGGAAPSLEVDGSRAYLGSGEVIREIDYADRLRVARTFTPAVRPALVVETGR